MMAPMEATMLILGHNSKNLTHAGTIGSLDADELQSTQFERIFSMIERFGSEDFHPGVS